MTNTIPYNTVPQPTPYNVGVFLLNFSNRNDGMSLGEAFCSDFDLLNSSISKGCNATALKNIVKYLDN